VRLPFGLGRRSSSGDGAESGGSSAGLDIGFADTGIAVAAPAPSHAWSSLPPIRRTTGDMPLVAAPGSFAESLPGSRGLPPIVQQLGHEVSHLATPGLVVARTRPVEAPSGGSMPAPVQRRAARPSQSAAVQTYAASEPEAPIADAPAHAAVAPAAPAALVAPAALAAVAAPEVAMPSVSPAIPDAAPLPFAPPIRSMPTVSRLAIHVPDRPLTSAASAARPAAVQRAAAAAEAAAAGAAPLAMPVSGGMRRVPSAGSPAMPVVSRQAASAPPDAVIAPSAVAAAAGTAAPAAPLPVAHRSAATEPAAHAATHLAAAPNAEPHRLGLGAPLNAVPASARPVGSSPVGPVVSRSTTSGPMPVAATSLIPTAQRSTGSEATPTSAALALPGPSHAAAPIAGAQGRTSATGTSAPARSAVQRLPALPHLPSLPHLPVARATPAPGRPGEAVGSGNSPGAASPVAGASVGSSGTSSASSATHAAPSIQTVPAPEIRPIAAANPIRPSFVLQRSASDADAEADDETGDAARPSPWWAPAAESRSTAASVLGAGFDGGPAVQRTAWAESGRSARASASVAHGPSAPSAFARAATAPTTLQRSAGPSTRPLPPARGAVPESANRATATSSAALATAAAAGSPAAVVVPGVTSGMVVQTSSSAVRPASPMGSSVSFGSAPDVQREDPPERPLSQSVGGTSAPSGSGTHGGRAHSERELEELAQALFSRIRGRLRNELIHDREAKGLTFDNV
jgi:trimeric autotransporter adhesin